MKKTHKRGTHKANVMTRAFDGKGKPIRGLWQRNAKYYAQITLSRPDGSKVVSKVPLKARTLTEAREARRKLLVERTEGEAHMVGTVHDELIVECPTEIADEVCRLTEGIMSEAMSGVLGGGVPVQVEAKACECWEEK